MSNKINKEIGLIPDFFHDIIAYIIPGWTLLIIVVIDSLLLQTIEITQIQALEFGMYLSVIVGAYVLGRVFEQVGLLTIHYSVPEVLQKWNKYSPNPKWSLLFDEKDEKYTKSFRTNAIKKITKWLEKQDGSALMEECIESGKDDYFNIIQFYLRERFPAVALYEKKQNATIILSRSLSIIFIVNAIVFTPAFLILYSDISSSLLNLYLCILWVIIQLGSGFVCYTRFIIDKRYHAMYIIEAFIATKKLLKSRNQTGTPRR